MPKRYGSAFRRTICDRIVADERVTELSRETGVSPATLHLWKRQALIDAGLRPGTKSTEVDELADPQLEALVRGPRGCPRRTSSVVCPSKRDHLPPRGQLSERVSQDSVTIFCVGSSH